MLSAAYKPLPLGLSGAALVAARFNLVSLSTRAAATAWRSFLGLIFLSLALRWGVYGRLGLGSCSIGCCSIVSCSTGIGLGGGNVTIGSLSAAIMASSLSDISAACLRPMAPLCSMADSLG